MASFLSARNIKRWLCLSVLFGSQASAQSGRSHADVPASPIGAAVLRICQPDNAIIQAAALRPEPRMIDRGDTGCTTLDDDAVFWTVKPQNGSGQLSEGQNLA
jgi:hypothetical protein